MCELIAGGSPRQLTLFPTCYCWLYTTHINTCYVLLLLLTAPMYTMLSKISEHTISCCYCGLHPCTPCCPKYQNIPYLATIVDCTHVHHVVQNIRTYHILLLLWTAPMYTMLSKISEHTISCCYCGLHPCTPCCPKYQNIPYLAAIVDCTHVHHVVQNIRTYHILLLLWTAPMYTMLSKISEHTISCCYCGLHPCTPCCPKYQNISYLATIVDCTHVHHVVQNIRTYHILLLLWTAPMYTMLSKISEHTISCCYCGLHPCTPCCPKYQNIPYLAAIVDCTHVHHVVQNIRTYHILLLLWTAPMYTMLSKISEHTISCCYCGLHPCTPCCPKYQNISYLATIVDCTHVHHVVQNIRTYHILLLLWTAPMYTMLSKISEHIISCYYCGLHPCTPCCPKYQNISYLATIVDCTHVHHVVQNIRTYHILLLLWTAPMYTMLSKISEHIISCYYCGLHPCTPCCPKYQNISYLATIVDCTHVHHVVQNIRTYHILLLLWTAPMYTMLSKISEHIISCYYCGLHPCKVSYSILRGIGNIAQENTTADIYIIGPATVPLELGNS